MAEVFNTSSSGANLTYYVTDPTLIQSLGFSTSTDCGPFNYSLVNELPNFINYDQNKGTLEV